MTRALVSIGLPFLNPGAFFIEAVQSVFCQTETNWELLLIDDGSTDGSLECARAITDPRVRVISDGKRKGLIARLNEWIDEAPGQYLARMDADDLMHPRRIELELVALEQRHADVAGSAAFVVDAERNVFGIRDLGEHFDHPVNALKRGIFIHPTVLARRDWYRRHRYDSAYPRAEDRELFVRGLQDSEYVQVREPLLFYTQTNWSRIGDIEIGYQSERRMLLRHGPATIGGIATGVLWCRSLAKSGGTSLFSALKINLPTPGSSVLRPVNAANLSEAMKALSTIRRQAVPGWNDTETEMSSTSSEAHLQ